MHSQTASVLVILWWCALPYVSWSELAGLWSSRILAGESYCSTSVGFLTECFRPMGDSVDALLFRIETHHLINAYSYFGPETTKAVQEFHASNGFFSGVWSFHSQQLLWKFLYPETHKCHPKKVSPPLNLSL